jgi:RNA polymerase sigma factor (sigma-70 family)
LRLVSAKCAAARSEKQPPLTSELSDIMRELIARLPERPRIALVLRHLENLGYDDIAAVMEIEESTARVLVRNGRERLRELLLERYPEWAAEGRTP